MMPLRVMTETEFWRLFKYDVEPDWLIKAHRKALRDQYTGKYELTGKAKEWFKRQIDEFDFSSVPMNSRHEIKSSILQSGEVMGLIKWSDQGGTRRYIATDRLTKNWDEIFPDHDPDIAFAVSANTPPSSIIMLDGWMLTLIEKVHRDAASTQDTKPGRLLLSHKFSILPQLEAGGWVEVVNGPNGVLAVMFSFKSLNEIMHKANISEAKLEKLLLDANGACAFHQNVLEGGGQSLRIRSSSVTRELRNFGGLLRLCERKIVSHKPSPFGIGQFVITSQGEKAGLGPAGNDFLDYFK